MKKTVSLILSALLLLPFLASCGESQTGSDPAQDTPSSPSAEVIAETEPETESPYIDDGLGNPDLEGYDFRILSCFFNDLETWKYVICDELTGVPLDDQLYESKEAVEDRLNIKFSVIEPGDDGAGYDAFKKSVMGGDDSFDMHIGKDWRTCDLGLKGYCYNMFDIDQFDFDKPWWPASTVKQLSVGDKMFAASNYASYCGIHWTRVMVANKDLLADFQMDVPYPQLRCCFLHTDLI